MGSVADAFTSLQAEAAAYPQPVQVWMRVMAGSFMSGLVVAIWDRRALWTVAMAVLTLGTLVGVRMVAPEVSRASAGALAHLVIWPVVLWRLWRPVASGGMVFGVWRSWVSTLIVMSLALDVLALTGVL